MLHERHNDRRGVDGTDRQGYQGSGSRDEFLSSTVEGWIGVIVHLEAAPGTESAMEAARVWGLGC